MNGDKENQFQHHKTESLRANNKIHIFSIDSLIQPDLFVQTVIPLSPNNSSHDGTPLLFLAKKSQQ